MWALALRSKGFKFRSCIFSLLVMELSLSYSCKINNRCIEQKKINLTTPLSRPKSANVVAIRPCNVSGKSVIGATFFLQENQHNSFFYIHKQTTLVRCETQTARRKLHYLRANYGLKQRVLIGGTSTKYLQNHGRQHCWHMHTSTATQGSSRSDTMFSLSSNRECSYFQIEFTKMGFIVL